MDCVSVLTTPPPPPARNLRSFDPPHHYVVAVSLIHRYIGELLDGHARPSQLHLEDKLAGTTFPAAGAAGSGFFPHAAKVTKPPGPVGGVNAVATKPLENGVGVGNRVVV